MFEFISRELIVMGGVLILMPIVYPAARLWYAGRNAEMKKHFHEITSDARNSMKKEERD